MCRARFSLRSPPRSSRWRTVLPELAGIGAEPVSLAKAASERRRPWWDQPRSRWPAEIAPTPGSCSSAGASWLIRRRISLEGLRFLVGGVDASGAESQRERARSFLLVCRARDTQLSAAAGQPGARQSDQPLAQTVGGGYDQSAELVEADAAYLYGLLASRQQHAQRFPGPALARVGERPLERSMCGSPRIKRVAFQSSLDPATERTFDLTDTLTGREQRPGQAGAVAAGSLERPQTPAGRELAGEAQRLAVPSALAGSCQSVTSAPVEASTTANACRCAWVSTPIT